MTPWARGAALVGMLLVMPRVARADMFGGENVTLGLILKRVTDSARGVRENLQELRKSTQLAAETAGFAREMVQVGRNLHTIIDNPLAFADHMSRSWYRAFPELYDSLANIHAVRESIDQAGHPSEYDPYAYVRAFDRMAGMTHSSFEVWAHAVDRWGINKNHDEAIKNLGEQRRIAVGNLATLADVINRSGLSPAQASVFTAQSSAVSALAQVEAAASLNSLVRTQSLLAIEAADAAERNRVAWHEQEDAALHIRAGEWDLDPMQGRRDLQW